MGQKQLLIQELKKTEDEIVSLKNTISKLYKEIWNTESEILSKRIAIEKIQEKINIIQDFDDASLDENISIDFTMPTNVNLNIIPVEVNLPDTMTLENAVRTVRQKAPAFGFYKNKKIECLNSSLISEEELINLFKKSL